MTLDTTEITFACLENPEYDNFAIQARAIKEDCTNEARKECEAVVKKYARIAAEKIVKLYRKHKTENSYPLYGG